MLLVPPQTVNFWRKLFLWNVNSGLSPFGDFIRTWYLLTVPSMDNHVSFPITILGKNLLFWHKRINQLENFNLLWQSLSINDYLTQIWYGCHFISFWFIQSNDDADKPSPFCCVLTYGLFFDNYWTRPMFSSVTKDWFFPEFPQFLVRLAPKLQCFALLHCIVLLQGALRLNNKPNCCRLSLILLILIYFPTKIFVLQSLIEVFFFFDWLVSKILRFILIPKGTKFNP